MIWTDAGVLRKKKQKIYTSDLSKHILSVSARTLDIKYRMCCKHHSADLSNTLWIMFDYENSPKIVVLIKTKMLFYLAFCLAVIFFHCLQPMLFFSVKYDFSSINRDMWCFSADCSHKNWPQPWLHDPDLLHISRLQSCHAVRICCHWEHLSQGWLCALLPSARRFPYSSRSDGQETL